MARGRKPSNNARLDLDDDQLSDDLLDFCEAHRGAPSKRIVSDALRAFIADRLKAEPELRKRFEEARKKRLATIEGGNVTVLPTAKKT